jgi:uncharacterized protein involved in exopolysaccharide biosynthesis
MDNSSKMNNKETENNNQSSEQNKLSTGNKNMLSYLVLLLKNRRKIVLITGIVTFLGLIYALLASPWYEAQVKILPPTRDSSKLNMYSGLASLVGINFLGFGYDKQVQYPEIIESNFVLDKILENKFKTSLYEKPVSLFQFWDTTIDSSEDDWKHELFEKSKKRLRSEYISTSIDKKSSILTLFVSAPKDPMLASEMANFIIKQIDIYNKYFRKIKARDQSDFISKGLAEAKENMEISMQALQTFMEKNKNTSSPEKKLLLERLQTEMDVQKSIYLELRKQLEISKIEEIKETETLDILEYAQTPVFKIKPKRIVIVLFSMITGFLLSLIYIPLSESIKSFIGRLKNILRNA